MESIKPDIFISADGSSTLRHPIIGDMYHSTAGAVGESTHIYINNGLKFVSQIKKEINILEIGFGSGLNLMLTIEEALKENLTIEYTTIELYPVDIAVINNLGYEKHCSEDTYDTYIKSHTAEWNKSVKIDKNITIHKINKSLPLVDLENINADVVYFDAFSPDTQPELWSKDIFTKIYNATQTGGRLVTYSAKGIVKQALREAGFEVKRTKGALGKHHMLICTKHI